MREANPELVALHPAGLQEEPPATVDPGLILAADRDRRIAFGLSINREEAMAAACRANPAAFEAWTSCRLLPADQAPRQHEAERRRG